MSAISPPSGNPPVQATMPKPEALEPQRVGPDHDSDADDRASVAAASATTKPTTNTSGQPIGLIVNTKA